MSTKTHVYQPPKGTRDFYPQDMAVRRYIEKVWREVSINHGFEEIDGPTFEHLELYTTKSGEEIVSQLFSFRREGGDTDYALRPEFTPTLARMYAARAGQLAKPTKWFCMPNFFRAERPQRGRLREFFQWNADIIGVPEGGIWEARQTVETIGVVVGVLRRFGFNPSQVRVKISDRRAVIPRLRQFGVPEERDDELWALLDMRPKITPDEYRDRAVKMELPREIVDYFDPERREIVRFDDDPTKLGYDDLQPTVDKKKATPGDLYHEIERAGLTEWCEYDNMIIRGLAYYTGTVFEVHEATGKERALAGGGRYDRLVQMFGGPKDTPAVGIAMGDVVLRLMLEDHGLLPDESELMDAVGARPDVFVICAREELDGDAAALIGRLRDGGLHVRQSYKSTRNVGKLLGDAAKCNARFAAIVGDEWSDGQVQLKDLETGEQNAVDVATIEQHVREQRQRGASPRR